MSKKLVIYRTKDLDGFSAAWAMHRVFRFNYEGDGIDFPYSVSNTRDENFIRYATYERTEGDLTVGYLSTHYGMSEDRLIESKAIDLDTDVFILGLSFYKPTIDAIAQAANSVTIINNSDKAPDLDYPPNVTVDVGREYSTGKRTWLHVFMGLPHEFTETFHDIQEVPDVIDILNSFITQDTSTYRNTQEIYAAINSYRFDLRFWDVELYDTEWKPRMIEEGKAICRARAQIIRSALTQVTRVEAFGHRNIPCVNCSEDTAHEVSSALSRRAAFGIVYTDIGKGKRKWVVKSDKENPNSIDVQGFARLMGGSGSRHVASFITSCTQEIEDVLRC